MKHKKHIEYFFLTNIQYALYFAPIMRLSYKQINDAYTIIISIIKFLFLKIIR